MTGGVKSAERALQVLHYFELHHEPAPLKSICAALGYPQSSTTALLKTLRIMGYLSYDMVKRVYSPTLKVHAMGAWVPAALFGSGEVLRALDGVHSGTRETIVVVTKNDIYVQYIAAKISTHQIRHHVDEGSMRPMTSTPLGWLLMSTLKDAEVDNIVRRCNIAAGLPASTNLAEIVKEVRRVRDNGYCYGENAPTVGGATIGVLLPTTIQDQPVAIGCGGVLERVRSNRQLYLDVLRREAAGVEMEPRKSRMSSRM